MGSDIFLGRDTQIHCSHHICIGNGVFAGEMYVCDSTVHQILADRTPKPLNGKIIVGDGVYLGFRTMLLKGTVIPGRSVVGSGAVCVSDYSKDGLEQLFICGNPAVVKSKGVTAKF
jgi:acetyltransferase-like isoleucine patch superfamily enzyme